MKEVYLDKERYIELIVKEETLHRLNVAGVKEWSKYESALIDEHKRNINEYKEAITELFDCLVIGEYK